jgi:hypothetical protein
LRLVAVMVWQVPDPVDTVVCAPDDGWKYHPKHIEPFPGVNKLCNVASCWIYIRMYLRCTNPWTLNNLSVTYVFLFHCTSLDLQQIILYLSQQMPDCILVVIMNRSISWTSAFSKVEIMLPLYGQSYMHLTFSGGH